MTPEQENAIRAQGRKCVDEIRQALKARPKPKWNVVVPPILKKTSPEDCAYGHKPCGICQQHRPDARPVRSGVMTANNQITRELKAPFLLLAFTFNRINRQFRE